MTQELRSAGLHKNMLALLKLLSLTVNNSDQKAVALMSLRLESMPCRDGWDGGVGCPRCRCPQVLRLDSASPSPFYKPYRF